MLAYVGASLNRDAIDARYIEEIRTGTTTYAGTVTTAGDGKTVTPLPGIIDLINDPAAEADPLKVSYPELVSTSRPTDFDTDQDGMPDAWEDLNGLNKNDASDSKVYTLDPKGFYTNLEVYINGIVEDITRSQNADALTAVDEYYPSQVFLSIHSVGGDAMQPVLFEYYSLDGKRLAAPAAGISVRRITYSDGSIVSDKVLK